MRLGYNNEVLRTKMVEGHRKLMFHHNKSLHHREVKNISQYLVVAHEFKTANQT